MKCQRISEIVHRATWVLLFVWGVGFAGCGGSEDASKTLYTSKSDFPDTVTEVLNADDWTTSFDHAAENRLVSVAHAIHFLAVQDDISDVDLINLVYYLWSYAYYGPTDPLTQEQIDILDTALTALSQMKDFKSLNSRAGELLEGYAAAVRWFYHHAVAQKLFSKHLSVLDTLLKHYTTTADLYNYDNYAEAVEQTLIAITTMADHALDSKTLADAFLEDADLLDRLEALGTSANAIDQQSLWPLNHVLQALGSLWLLGKGAWASELDSRATAIIDAHASYSDQTALKTGFLKSYVRYSYRLVDDCTTDFPNHCVAVTANEILPIEQNCSRTLTIRAQGMSEAQLNAACDALVLQEATFHQRLQSDGIPVADDSNARLEIVVFDNWNEYNVYGWLFFQIDTDNGGIYMEGEPYDLQNQARFYAYRADWLPEFKIWNLRHEYIHYLDGRFIQYGPFGHYPHHIVWWTEGLAEYLSKGIDNSWAIGLPASTPQASWPTLGEIFDTNYDHDIDRVYGWTYLATRFIFEQHENAVLAMTDHLKNDEFGAYTAVLDEWSSTHQADFATWLQGNFATAGVLTQTSHLSAQLEADRRFKRHLAERAWQQHSRAAQWKLRQFENP